MSYQLSKKYGFKDKDYLVPANFTQDPLRARQVSDVLSKMKRQIRLNGEKHTATLHYMSKYGYIPMWILVKVLSFGIIAELYVILKNDDKKAIADFYDLTIEEMEIYLSLLANFRNLCAHEDILYDHRTQRFIPDTKYHSEMNIEKNEENEYKEMKDNVITEVKKIFRPEFINRIDDIIVFHKLSRDEAAKILEINLKEIRNRTKENLQIDFKLDKQAKELVLNKGFKEEFGARELKRTLTSMLEDLIAEEKLKGNIHSGDNITIAANDDKLVIKKIDE